MSNIIKWFNSRKVEPFKVETFSSVKRGESSFGYQSFDGERSVQDQASDPDINMNEAKNLFSGGTNFEKAGSHFNKNNRSSLFSAYNDDSSSAPSSGRPRLFSSYDEEEGGSVLDAGQPGDGRPRPSGNYNPDEYNADDSASVGPTFRELDYPEAKANEVSLPPTHKELAEKNAEIAALQQELKKSKSTIEQLTLDRNTLQTQIQEIPDLRNASRQEGYDAAMKELKDKEKVEYNAQQSDYLDKMEASWKAAIAEVDKLNNAIDTIDEELPQIVVGYVRQLIGAERKINDELVVNVVQAALAQLKDVQQIVFTVNPEDAAVLSEKYPQYGVSIDPSIPKGSVKLKTKVGEIKLSVDSWMDSLEQQINEQITTAQNHKAE